MRRVVITGLGLVTPLACGVETTWNRLLSGKSGVRSIDKFDVSDLPCKIGAQIPLQSDGDNEGGYNPDDYMPLKERRRVDDFIEFGMAAAQQALEDSGWKPETEDEQFRTGVMIGSGIGGLKRIEEGGFIVRDLGPRKMSPFFLPGLLINLVSGFVSIKHGLKGPNHANATACSTGAHAIGDAARMIALDDADVMVAGGTESSISRLAVAGFVACRALSTSFNDTPERASRPYDKDRDGFVMGEGSGVVVLEEIEHARARGAHIYAEVTGYGMSGDAHHITAPAKDGNGAFRCMQMALKRAGIGPESVDYVNAHGTSTPLGDEIELNAVTRLFDSKTDHLKMSSTKSAIGHLLGAAGAVESIFCILAIRDNIAPPTLNLDNPSVSTDIDLVPFDAKPHEINVALSNSFGFGGTNASLVFSRLAD